MKKKMTKKRAIELAVIALHMEIASGLIQSEEFDDALEVLEKYYDIGKITMSVSPTIEEWLEENEGTIT